MRYNVNGQHGGAASMLLDWRTYLLLIEIPFCFFRYPYRVASAYDHWRAHPTLRRACKASAHFTRASWVVDANVFVLLQLVLGFHKLPFMTSKFLWYAQSEKRHQLFSRGRAKLRFAEALRSMAFVSQPPEIACPSAWGKIPMPPFSDVFLGKVTSSMRVANTYSYVHASAAKRLQFWNLIGM